MRVCPITYEPIGEKEKYSQKGLRHLSPVLTTLNDLPFTAEEQRQEAETHATKLSIQGVQSKFSAVLNIKDSVFEIVDNGGRYILKPQAEYYKHLPENENLTMHLGAIVGIEVPLHGLIYSKDGTLTYFIRRFDRKGQKGKVHVEDFAQLSGENRDTKYNSSMERVAKVIDLCTFPAVEKVKLFKRTIFSFLVGNEDMHLKNFSLIVRDDKIELSPAYDLVNSTLVLAAPKEELALPIRGRKKNLTRNDLVKYFGMECLGITQVVCEEVLDDFRKSIPKWQELVGRSFLPTKIQDRYSSLIKDRSKRIELR